MFNIHVVEKKLNGVLMEPIASTSREEHVSKKCRFEDCVQQDDSSDIDVIYEHVEEDIAVRLNADEIAAVLAQLPFKNVVRLGRINKEWSLVSPRVTIREVRLGSDLGLESMSGKSKDAIDRIRLLEKYKGVRRINVEKIKSSLVKIKPVFQELGSFCYRVEEIVGSPENIELSMNGYSIGGGLNQSLFSYVESVEKSDNVNNIQTIYLQSREIDFKKPFGKDEDIFELVRRCPKATKLVLALTRFEIQKQKFLDTWLEYGSRIKKIHLYRGDQSVFDSFRNLRYLTEFKTEIRDLDIGTISSLWENCKFLQSLSMSCSADFLAVVRRFKNLRKLSLKMKARPFGKILETELLTLFNDIEFAHNLTSIKIMNHTQGCLFILRQPIINAIASTCTKLRHVELVTGIEKLMPFDQSSTLQSLTIVDNGINRKNRGFQDLESVFANNIYLKSFNIYRCYADQMENELMIPFIETHPLIKFNIFLTHQIDSLETKWLRKMMSKHDNLCVRYKRII